MKEIIDEDLIKMDHQEFSTLQKLKLMNRPTLEKYALKQRNILQWLALSVLISFICGLIIGMVYVVEIANHNTKVAYNIGEELCQYKYGEGMSTIRTRNIFDSFNIAIVCENNVIGISGD